MRYRKLPPFVVASHNYWWATARSCCPVAAMGALPGPALQLAGQTRLHSLGHLLFDLFHKGVAIQVVSVVDHLALGDSQDHDKRQRDFE